MTTADCTDESAEPNPGSARIASAVCRTDVAKLLSSDSLTCKSDTVPPPLLLKSA